LGIFASAAIVPSAFAVRHVIPDFLPYSC